MRRLRTLAAVVGITLIAACGSNGSEDETTAVPEGDGGASQTDGDQAESAMSLVGNRWELQQAETAKVSATTGADVTAWLRVDESGEVRGNTGCNGFGGSARVGDGIITFEPLMATKKGCSGTLGDLDTAVLGVLQGKVTVDISGDSLTLTNAEDEMLKFTVGEPPSTDM